MNAQTRMAPPPKPERDARRTQGALIENLRAAVGPSHVVTGARALKRYATGYRTGAGPCVAAVRPGSLLEMWRVLKLCVEAGAIVIPQAANTGLTGGSTPAEGYDRDVVILSTMRLKGVRLLQDGAQAVCLPGATLNELERALGAVGREPHSVIGSSCIGASVVGGVCNNSGGALIRRGPAYTELALFARLNERGELELINHLAIDLGQEPEAMLEALDRGEINLDARITPTERRACDHEYAAHVRDIEAPTPARFNADARRLYEASGSAGKIAVFAVRLDTFAPERNATTFYIGANAADDLTRLRRAMLASAIPLPIAAEYMHREAFDIAARYGKDAFLAIKALGTDRLAPLNRLKNGLDAISGSLGDRVLQALADIAPSHLPERMRSFRDKFEHHLILKVSAGALDATRALLNAILPSQSAAFFECTPHESECAFLHRFVMAGAAVRYRALHADKVADIVALDFALPRNESEWAEQLPDALNQRLAGKLYYGHFFCYVFHHDYLVRKDCDVHAFEEAIHARLDTQGAEYPAEHNVGHLYSAKPSLERHYRALDPCNSFNPGIGKLPKGQFWRVLDLETQ